jgi:Icc-related predicted phosphoesterase
MPTASDVVRLAAMSDVHYSRTSAGALLPVFQQVNESADMMVLCGDLTDYGHVEEAKLLAKDLTSGLNIPVVAVLGNHDFESGEEVEITKILTDAGVRILDGDTCEVQGVGFAGVRGFCGGFGRGALGAWGEPIIKQFVHEALQEVLKLESALARLKTDQRIAVIHYAPVRETVEGEPLEIYPFLGSSRLEEPLTRYSVSAVFHGHAHRGSPEGRTSSGIPVFNVCLPLLKARYPDRPPFRLFEVPRAVATAPGDGRSGELPTERRQGGRRSTDRAAPGQLVEAAPPPGAAPSTGRGGSKS